MFHITPDFTKSVIESVYKDFCLLVRVVGPKGEFVAEFPVDVTSDESINVQRVPYGCSLVPIKKDIRESDMISSLTPQFWTCNCKSKFTRHIAHCKCGLCGTHIKDSVSRLPKTELLMEPEWCDHLGSNIIKNYEN